VALAAAPLRAGAPQTAASALLDRLAWRLLAFDPAQATTLGVDVGAQAGLRGRLEDRSPAGVAARRRFLAESLAELARLPRAGLDAVTATSLAVAESAFRTALDGMALPYGVATIGSWRNTPYTVVQNVGAWLDVPQLLDGDQPVRDAADAGAYLARLSAMAAQLDGETLRIREARGQGLVPPSFLLEKTIAGVARTIADALAPGGPLIGPLAGKVKAIPAPGLRVRRGSSGRRSCRRWSGSWPSCGPSGPWRATRPASVCGRMAPNGTPGACVPARRRGAAPRRSMRSAARS
jgi:uncharacterized protein (DUF885 family)